MQNPANPPTPKQQEDLRNSPLFMQLKRLVSLGNRSVVNYWRIGELVTRLACTHKQLPGKPSWRSWIPDELSISSSMLTKCCQLRQTMRKDEAAGCDEDGLPISKVLAAIIGGARYKELLKMAETLSAREIALEALATNPTKRTVSRRPKTPSPLSSRADLKRIISRLNYLQTGLYSLLIPQIDKHLAAAQHKNMSVRQEIQRLLEEVIRKAGNVQTSLRDAVRQLRPLLEVKKPKES